MLFLFIIEFARAHSCKNSNHAHLFQFFTRPQCFITYLVDPVSSDI